MTNATIAAPALAPASAPGPADPASIDRRRFIIGGSFLLTAGVAYARQPDTAINLLGKRKLDALIPKKFGAWEFYSNSGLVIPPNDQLSQQLYSQMLTRVYLAPDRTPVMLLIAQSPGQTGVLQIHRPEICYPTGGYKLSKSGIHQLPLGTSQLTTTEFTASADDRIEQLVYWTRVGTDMPVSWIQQRWAVAKANLQGRIPDAVLVRVSTLSPDRDGSMDTLDDFIGDLAKAVAPDARHFLFGADPFQPR